MDEPQDPPPDMSPSPEMGAGRARDPGPALSLDAQVAALSRAALFRDVEPQQLRLLAFSAAERVAATGEVIARAGTPGVPALLVTAGLVEAGGGEGAPLRAGPGTLLNGHGALAGGTLAGGALGGAALAHDLRAVVPSRLLVMDRTLIARLIREYPAMGRAMLRGLGGDLRLLAAALRAGLPGRPNAGPHTASSGAPPGG